MRASSLILSQTLVLQAMLATSTRQAEQVPSGLRPRPTSRWRASIPSATNPARNARLSRRNGGSEDWRQILRNPDDVIWGFPPIEVVRCRQVDNIANSLAPKMLSRENRTYSFTNVGSYARRP